MKLMYFPKSIVEDYLKCVLLSWQNLESAQIDILQLDLGYIYMH